MFQIFLGYSFFVNVQDITGTRASFLVVIFFVCSLRCASLRLRRLNSGCPSVIEWVAQPATNPGVKTLWWFSAWFSPALKMLSETFDAKYPNRMVGSSHSSPSAPNPKKIWSHLIIAHHSIPCTVLIHHGASCISPGHVLPVTDSTTEKVLLDRLQSFLALIIPWGVQAMKNMAGTGWSVSLHQWHGI